MLVVKITISFFPDSLPFFNSVGNAEPPLLGKDASNTRLDGNNMEWIQSKQK